MYERHKQHLIAKYGMDNPPELHNADVKAILDGAQCRRKKAKTHVFD